jgi:hypothetical protein
METVPPPPCGNRQNRPNEGLTTFSSAAKDPEFRRNIIITNMIGQQSPPLRPNAIRLSLLFYEVLFRKLELLKHETPIGLKKAELLSRHRLITPSQKR